MTKEREIEILMLDRCTKSEAEKHLKNGSTVCNTKPEISMSSNGERVTVSCKCGYICDVEIMF